MKPAEQVLNALRTAVQVLVTLFFAYMLGAVLVEVAGRYVFGYSIAWASETATFAQVWMILLAAGLAVRDNLHVSVDALVNVLPPAVLRIFTVLVAVTCIWFIVQAVTGSIALVRIGLAETSPVLGLPMWIAYLALPVGLGYFGLELVLSMWGRWRDPKAAIDKVQGSG